MADYYPLLARAIEGLANQTPEMREAIYNRARQALVMQLQALDPPASEADIDRERASLDLAINVVEASYFPPEQPSQTEPQWLKEPTQVLMEPVVDDAVVHNQPSSARVEPQAIGEGPVEENGLPDVLNEVDSLGPERPRISSKHHSSDQANHIRAIILVASILAVVLSIASWKLYNRELQNEDQLAAEQSSETTENLVSDMGKFTERLGGSVAPSLETTEGAQATVAVQGALFVETDPSTAGLPPNQQKLLASRGIARWQLEQQDESGARLAAPVLRADLEFPDNGSKLSMVMRKNTQNYAYSHTIDLVFSPAEGDTGHDIVAAAILQMKDRDDEIQGTPLIGQIVPVTRNVFTIGLSDIPTEQDRNSQLLREKAWLDLMVTFKDGRSGRIIFEKGPTGYQAINAAFRNW